MLCFALACGDSGASLTVNVITDYAPGDEFALVRTSLPEGIRAERLASSGESEAFRRGQRVANLSGIGASAIVRVDLLRRDGTLLASRVRSSNLDGSATMTVVFTRNCEGIECGAEEICIDAQCVNQDCDPSTPAQCSGGICASDAQCTGAVAECASRRCVGGLCLAVSDEAACAEDEFCDASEGCVPRVPAADGGVDAGACEGTCDTGNPCTQGRLACEGMRSECVPAPVPVGEACAIGGEMGSCDGAGACVIGCVEGERCERDSACELGVVRCDSGVRVCEADGPAPMGTECRESAGECDVAEVCDGVSTTCPDDVLLGAETTCRAAGGPCDVAETCAGGPTCPSDGFRTAGSACTGGFCNGLVGACQSGCTPGAECDTGNPCEVGAFDCSGPSPACERVSLRADGTSCGDTILGAFGACDYANSCDESATRSRTNTARECRAGACSDVPQVESDSCSRSRDGTSCGMTSCGSYGACGGFSNSCDTTGTQTRTCTDRRCASDACGSPTRTESRGCSRTLSESCGDLVDNDCDGTCDEGCRVPIYRGLRGSDHRYARTTGELTAAGFTLEGIAFYLYATQATGTVAFYSCRVGSSDHFLSTSASCEGQTVLSRVGYVRPRSSPSCGSVSLFRLFWPGRDHFFTTNASERASALAGPYIDEGVGAQVWRTM